MRKNIRGLRIEEHKELVNVTLETYVPSKYVIVDTETSDVWVHDGKTFRRALNQDMEPVRDIIRPYVGPWDYSK